MLAWIDMAGRLLLLECCGATYRTARRLKRAIGAQKAEITVSPEVLHDLREIGRTRPEIAIV
jgi:hypothetical protein